MSSAAVMIGALRVNVTMRKFLHTCSFKFTLAYCFGLLVVLSQNLLHCIIKHKTSGSGSHTWFSFVFPIAKLMVKVTPLSFQVSSCLNSGTVRRFKLHAKKK